MFSEAGGAVSPHGVEFAEEGGGQPAKPLKAPAKPTAEMIAMLLSMRSVIFFSGHGVYTALEDVGNRSSTGSVRGRGKSFQHRCVDHSQNDKNHQVVSIGYAFFGALSELPAHASGGQRMPVLVVRDLLAKSLSLI